MDKVYTLVKKIKKGKVASYLQIASTLSLHPRQVAKILSKNPKPVKIPCHRVVMANGKLGGYRYGIKKKAESLKKEGIIIKNGKISKEYFQKI